MRSDHVRAGVPVLAQAHRDRRADRVPDRRVAGARRGVADQAGVPDVPAGHRRSSSTPRRSIHAEKSIFINGTRRASTACGSRTPAIVLTDGYHRIGQGSEFTFPKGAPCRICPQWRTTPTRRGRCRCPSGEEFPLYGAYSLIIATFLGTMGLPHVIVRFYTNPNGTAARRTTLIVLGLLSVFYLMPPIYGALGRLYTPELLMTGADRRGGAGAADPDDRRHRRPAARRAGGGWRVRGVPVDVLGPGRVAGGRAVAGRAAAAAACAGSGSPRCSRASCRWR